MERLDFVPAKEAVRLWNADKRTLIKRVKAGSLLGFLEACGTTKTVWYFETPKAKYERLNN